MESHLAISGNRKFSSLSNNRDWKGIYTKDCYLWFANLTTYTSNGIKMTSYQTFTTNTGTRSMADIWDIYVYNSIQRLEEVFLRLMKPISQMVSILMPYFPYQYYDLLDK